MTWIEIHILNVIL